MRPCRECDRRRVSDAGAQATGIRLIDEPAGIHTVGRNEPFEVVAEVRGRVPDLSSTLESVNDLADDRMVAAEQLARAHDVPGAQELPNPCRRDAPASVGSSHVMDDVNLEAVAETESGEGLRSTDATPTEAEVGADQHGLGGQCVHQNETGELVSCQRREIFVEAQHQHGVHAGIGKQTYFLVHPNEVLGALVGGQQR
jgi:hypothetical protein